MNTNEELFIGEHLNDIDKYPDVVVGDDAQTLEVGLAEDTGFTAMFPDSIVQLIFEDLELGLVGLGIWRRH